MTAVFRSLWRGARPRLPVLGWLLALAACWGGGGLGSSLVEARTAYITQQGRVNGSITPLQAFLDPTVDKMVLLEDVYLNSTEWAPYQGSLNTMLHLNRSLTIIAVNSTVLLDHRYLPMGFVLDPGVTLRYVDVAVAGLRSPSQMVLTGTGTTIGTDFIFGTNGSVRASQNLTRLMNTCQAPQRIVSEMLATPRPAGFPGSQQAEVIPGGATFRGVHYPSAVHVIDAVLPPKPPLDTKDANYADFPGFTVTLKNTTWLCPDALPEEGGSSAVATVVIVVPVVLGVLLLAVLLAGWWWCSRRRRRQRAGRLRAGDEELQLGKPGGPLLSLKPSGSSALYNLLGPDADEWELVAWRVGGEAGGKLVVPAASSGGKAIAAGAGAVTADAAAAATCLEGLALGPLVGAGSFGRVFRGRWRGQQVAVKIIKHDVGMAQKVINEADLMLTLHHPNVVVGLCYATFVNKQQPSSEEEGDSGTCMGTGTTRGSDEGRLPSSNALPSGSAGGGLYMDFTAPFGSGNSDSSGQSSRGPIEAQTVLVSEYCGAGTLTDASRDGTLLMANKQYDVNHMVQLLVDVAEGMHYIHSRNVLHGDLKAANVLLQQDANAPRGHTAKITDFGLSRTLMQGETHRSTRTMGTVTHMPPELLRAGKLSAAGDVYAFGVMMWEVMSGRPAFAGLHMAEVVERVVFHNQRPPLVALQGNNSDIIGAPSGLALLALHGPFLQDTPTPTAAMMASFAAQEGAAGAGRDIDSSVDDAGPSLRGAPSARTVSIEAPADWPADWVQLMTACWDTAPAKRPTFKQVIHTLRAMLVARGGSPRPSAGSSAGSSSACGSGSGGNSAALLAVSRVAAPAMSPVLEQSSTVPCALAPLPALTSPCCINGFSVRAQSTSSSSVSPSAAPLRVTVQLPGLPSLSVVGPVGSGGSAGATPPQGAESKQPGAHMGVQDL